MPTSLGFIETDSLIGAVEAANIMAKNFNVILSGKEFLSGNIVAVKIIGDAEDVRLALHAGEEAVKKLGKNVLSHIIDEPDEQLTAILPELNYLYLLQKKLVSEKKEERPQVTEPEEKKIKHTDEIKIVEPGSKNDVDNQITKREREQKRKRVKEKVIKKITGKIREPDLNFRNDTIARLRREALGIKEPERIEKKKKEIAPKKKEEIHNPGLESLNVHHLRKLARDTENFPIKGRDISKANRELLLNYFKQIK